MALGAKPLLKVEDNRDLRIGRPGPRDPARCLFVTVALLSLLTPLLVRAGTFPDARDLPPADWVGPVFRLSQSYPTQPPKRSPRPWEAIDFRQQPATYARTVLAYAYAGNISIDWVVQSNTVRPWYHAPWMHWGDNGREFIHGLTRERGPRPHELSPTQDSRFHTWAMSVYNEPGGYTLGRVWADPTAPDPSAAIFPVGTVAVKLLFTTATVAEVPYLRGAPEWQGHITVGPDAERDVRIVRLLQIDFAVRDPRANGTTGWIFGSFQYDAAAPAKSPWEKVVPVSLMWGNDPGITPEMVAEGARLQETWINPRAPIVQHRKAQGRNLGWAGRGNGPIDDQGSSCLSCHATAQFPNISRFIPAQELSDREKLRWFRNIGPAQPFDPQAQSLDYSLQLTMGMLKFHEWAQSGGGDLETTKPPMTDSEGSQKDSTHGRP